MLVLLDACARLRKLGIDFTVRFVGRFVSEAFQREVHALVKRCDLEHQVEIAGQLTGKDKWQAFAQADVFCFPTFYASETFGIVLLEAMSFALPVVATNWRGVPDIVEDGGSRFPGSDQRSAALAARVKELICDAELRARMGRRGREKFVREFTWEVCRQRLELAFLAVSDRSDVQ